MASSRLSRVCPAPGGRPGPPARLTATAVPAGAAAARLLFRLLRMPSSLATLVLALAGDWLLAIFGKGFVHSHGVLMVMAAGNLASSYFGLGGIALSMTGHQGAAMRIMVFTSVLGLVAMAP